MSLYEEIPYPAGAFQQSHPDRLETLARLFGMTPPDIRRCRVLELGCADGSNLIPMACALRESQFVGVDLSAKQLKAGQEFITSLKLPNIELRHSDIRGVGASFGKFDYVIAHGVYSWVPADVQQKLLEICRERLNDNGVAYVSYNTYPGWRMRGMLRDMMLYHSRKFGDPREQIEQARALIQWLGESVQSEASPYSVLLRRELEQMERWHDTYLRHDSLAEINEPVYFHQFVERAERHGLQYLAEAEFASMLANNYPPAVNETLDRLARNIIELEQYMDFVRNRLFRQTLLCRREIKLDRALGPWSPAPFYIASPLKPANPRPDLRSTQAETFHSNNQLTLSSTQPIVKAGLTWLRRQWPLPVSFNDLVSEARALLKAEDRTETTEDAGLEAEREILGGALLTCFTKGLCEFHLHPADYVLEAGPRPLACPWVRLQAGRGGFVINRRHEYVATDHVAQHLLPLLDGQHDRDRLTDALMVLIEKGTLTVSLDDKPVREPELTRKIVARELEAKLAGFARTALLVG